jgi:hypothetical protein
LPTDALAGSSVSSKSVGFGRARWRRERNGGCLRAVEAAIELGRHDLLYLLRHQTNYQVDDALLVPVLIAIAGPFLLLRFHHTADPLRHEPDDRVDDPLLVGVAPASMPVPVVAPVPVAVVALVTVAPAATPAASFVFPVTAIVLARP